MTRQPATLYSPRDPSEQMISLVADLWACRRMSTLDIALEMNIHEAAVVRMLDMIRRRRAQDVPLPIGKRAAE